jgi:uncharacterized protein YbjQ (UPF0145 family)
MATFRIELECDNAAFDDSPGHEIARILKRVASEILASGELYPNSAQWIRDVNGNRVGTYKYESR